MVHTYSLIHDDLPCMDNDDYRRGQARRTTRSSARRWPCWPATRLLTAAFETAASAATDPAVTVEGHAASWRSSAGELGMVGGQVLDMDAEEQELTEQGIYDIQCRKTGALIQAACQIGVVAAGGTQQQLDAAKTYAQNLGLAFQIRDDMLDVLGDAAKLGKATDVDENKNTFVRLYGIGALLEDDRVRDEDRHRRAAAALKIPTSSSKWHGSWPCVNTDAFGRGERLPAVTESL